MSDTPVRRPTWVWISLLILQSLQLLTLLPWLPMAGLSVMAFDAPGSEKMWQPWAFVLAMWSYPLWLLLAGAISWILFAIRWYKSAVALAVVFTLPGPALLLVLILAN